MSTPKSVAIAEAFGPFDDILDVRSPAEYVDDHLPGAISVPVLNDEERARIGTLYTQVSPFEAQRQGAALIARNIAQYLETVLADKPKQWRPLVYCWRGGMRSGAMAHILAQIGWRVGKLEGGYKSYRRHVIDALEVLPSGFQWRVICGPTGSGKSRLLQALAEQGAQVLDLEQLAEHRGSLLGNLPDQPQPSQKTFESRIWQTLRQFDPQRPVFVEAESRKVGVLTVPTMLLDHMRAARCIAIEAPQDARIELLFEDYAHFLRNPELLKQRLSLLLELHGHKTIEHWCQMAEQGEWQALVRELLSQHYDPAYRRSSDVSFAQLKSANVLHLPRLDKAATQEAAASILETKDFL